MELDVAPPGAVVVPEMMIGVAAAAARHRFDFFFHMRVDCLPARIRVLKTKMPSFLNTTAPVSRLSFFQEPHGSCASAVALAGYGEKHL